MSTSFAVIASGGRQLTVKPGDVVRVDRLSEDAGNKVTFDKVLLVGSGSDVQVGKPHVEGASVAAEVINEHRDRKVLVFKKKRRKGHRKMRGHRQYYSLVRIDSINAG